MRYFFALLFFCFFIGCKKEPVNNTVSKENKVYKQSEMAALMLKMYSVSLENKNRILEGKKLSDFPKDFLNIHNAELTDPSDRNAAFNGFSELYLQSIKKVFNSAKDSLIIKHNLAVNSCISCHKTTCIGPIPKIKKLLIP
ncbi:hypothetical protein [Polaribacter sp.]|uniref:hypothetical protein n=1 Tax=Polaribacter sp. TaxID=1920175 RepID=UPI003F6D4F7F